MSIRLERPRTFKAALHERLAEMIRELELLPGERLVEADLAERLSVSKTPIREALLLLERDGLVEMVPHTGTRVSWPSVAEYADLQLVLTALEQPSLAAVVNHASPDQIHALEQLLKRCQDARAQHDSGRYFTALLKSHKLMFGPSRPLWSTHIIEATLMHARRYERVFIHQFEDTWDIELEIVRQRLLHVKRGDALGAAQAVPEGQRKLLQLFEERSTHPLVARYLQPQAADGNLASSQVV
jgi:DNA-binding GntR family transcriptional regulator